MTTVRKQKSGDQLAVGDWIAPGALLDGAAEVLHVLKYQPKDTIAEDVHVHLVVREQGMIAPYADIVSGGWLAELASDEDLARYREVAERAQAIADIRAFANWLETNPWAPMPNHFDASVHLDERHIGGPNVPDSYSKVREVADRIGVQREERLDDRTVARKGFGRIDYAVIAWHPDGRPAEPAPELLHFDFALGDSACGLAAVTPHEGVADWSKVTCKDCLDAVPF